MTPAWNVRTHHFSSPKYETRLSVTAMPRSIQIIHKIQKVFGGGGEAGGGSCPIVRGAPYHLPKICNSK